MINLILFCFLYISSCTHSNIRTDREKAIELSNKAMELFSKESVKFEPNRDTLQIALKYIENAIQEDSTFMQARINKVSILLKLQEYEKAISTLELVNVQKEEPEFLILEGNIYEKIGKLGKAQLKYNEALELNKNFIQKEPNNMENLATRAYILLFLNGKEMAIEEIEKLSKEYPNNKELEYFSQIIKHFNKEEYLQSL